MANDYATATRFVKTCPYCNSFSVAYRTRMHIYRCARCGGKFKTPVLVEVANERRFSRLPIHLKTKE